MDRDRFAQQLGQVREVRARHPELLRNRHASRRRRSLLGSDGRLLLVDVTDPARGSLAAPSDDRALSVRSEVLYRVCEALEVRGVDGVVGASDVIEDLVMLDALGDRLAIGAINPGLEGGDRAFASATTAYDPAAISALHLDGGSLHVPVDSDDATGAGRLVEAARVADILSTSGSVVMMAPSWWRGAGADTRRDDSADALVRAVEVIAALGSRSSFTWLVLPAVDGLSQALDATTLPVLVRAPDTVPRAHPERWEELLSHANVRGVLLPVGALFPLSGDSLDPLRQMAELVHPEVDPRAVPDESESPS